MEAVVACFKVIYQHLREGTGGNPGTWHQNEPRTPECGADVLVTLLRHSEVLIGIMEASGFLPTPSSKVCIPQIVLVFLVPAGRFG
jgi:hypothetical protein